MISHAYTKRRLLKELAYKVGIRQELSQRILDALVEIAYRESANQGFVLPGLCKLEVIDRKARKLRNPRTGAALVLPPHKALKVTLSGLAKRAVAPPPRAVPEAEYFPQKPEPPKPEPTVPESTTQKINLNALETEPKPEIPASETATTDLPEPLASEPKADETPDGGTAEEASAPPESIFFKCPQCGQEIEAPGDAGGAEAECPLCGSIVTIPATNEDGSLGKSEIVTVKEAAKMDPAILKNMTIRINTEDLRLDDLSPSVQKTSSDPAIAPAVPSSDLMISFFCEACHQEIEASPDMAGTETGCPNCGATIAVPLASQTSDDASRDSKPSAAQLQAQKNRTMRININDF